MHSDLERKISHLMRITIASGLAGLDLSLKGEENMRQIDAREYISTLKELTKEGKEVSMLISGSSMSPYLVHARDSICFKKPDRRLKKGDMVFFQRTTGQYVMHRIVKIKKDGYYMLGDAQREIEGPIKEEQIFALVTRVKRRGKWEGPESFWWKFFAHVWIHLVPVRQGIVSVYRIGHRIFKKEKK